MRWISTMITQFCVTLYIGPEKISSIEAKACTFHGAVPLNSRLKSDVCPRALEIFKWLAREYELA
jgi:hypothetical protein